jgi:hypothetical protein
MTASQTPSSVAERRLAIARRLFRAMVAKDPDRSITLCDGGGEVVARHDPTRSDGGGLPHVKATGREDRRIDQN